MKDVINEYLSLKALFHEKTEGMITSCSSCSGCSSDGSDGGGGGGGGGE